jgi:hypothetical protein
MCHKKKSVNQQTNSSSNDTQEQRTAFCKEYMLVPGIFRDNGFIFSVLQNVRRWNPDTISPLRRWTGLAKGWKRLQAEWSTCCGAAVWHTRVPQMGSWRIITRMFCIMFGLPVFSFLMGCHIYWYLIPNLYTYTYSLFVFTIIVSKCERFIFLLVSFC